MAGKSAWESKVTEYGDGVQRYQYPDGAVHFYGLPLLTWQSLAEAGKTGPEYPWAVVTQNYGVYLMEAGQDCSQRVAVTLDLPPGKPAEAVALAWVRAQMAGKIALSKYELGPAKPSRWLPENPFGLTDGEYLDLLTRRDEEVASGRIRTLTPVE